MHLVIFERRGVVPTIQDAWKHSNCSKKVGHWNTILMP